MPTTHQCGGEKVIASVIERCSRFTPLIYAKMERVTGDYGKKQCTKVTRLVQNTYHDVRQSAPRHYGRISRLTTKSVETI